MRKKKDTGKRNTFFIGIFIIVIMTGSSLGYYFGEEDSGTIKYNDHKLSRAQNGQITAKINGQIIYFQNRFHIEFIILCAFVSGLLMSRLFSKYF